MNWTDIASFVMSTAAILSSIGLILKANSEKSRMNADTEKTHVETYNLLATQLKEAHEEIDRLRSAIRNVQDHIVYEDYLLRGIARLTAAIVAADKVVPWEPMSFEQFMEHKLTKETKDGRK